MLQTTRKRRTLVLSTKVLKMAVPNLGSLASAAIVVDEHYCQAGARPQATWIENKAREESCYLRHI